MKYSSRLKRHFFFLQLLIWFQRSLRLIFRAAWLGAGGYLLGWGSQKNWGILPDERDWLVIAILFAASSLLFVPFSWPRRNNILWLIDQRLGFHEQISSIWQAIRDEQFTFLSEPLSEDVLQMIPVVRKRILLHGWFIGRELLSLTIIGLLAFGVYSTSFQYRFSTADITNTKEEKLPKLIEDPTADNLFPSSLPIPFPEDFQEDLSSNPFGDNSTPNSSEASSNAEYTEESLSLLKKTLSQLSEAMSQTAAGFEAGQALQNMDLEKAADALEDWADHIDYLSDETKEQVAQAMEKTGSSLENSAFEQLSIDMKKAASLLQPEESSENITDERAQSRSNLRTKDQIDQLANDFREIEKQLSGDKLGSGGVDTENEQEGEPELSTMNSPGAGIGSSSRTSSEAQPFARIDGNGGLIELPIENVDGSNILTKSNSENTGSQQISGFGTSSFSPIADPEQTYIIPFSYPWKWRNVVSEYFLKNQ